jgi:hypothetical protein
MIPDSTAVELGYAVPRLVPVDFEASRSWWEQLVAAGFDPRQPVEHVAAADLADATSPRAPTGSARRAASTC